MRKYLIEISGLYSLFKKFLCIEYTDTVPGVFYVEREREHIIKMEENPEYKARTYNDYEKGIFVTLYDNGLITSVTTTRFPLFIINSSHEPVTVPGIHDSYITIEPDSYILYDPGR